MSSFRQRPSRRKARNPRASALVLGLAATDVQYHDRRAVLLPVKSGDHRSRYAAGQRLAVKPYVPGPNVCHVILTDVKGPRELFSLGDVDYGIARDLGHVRLDDFRNSWLEAHDVDWHERMYEEWNESGDMSDVLFERLAERFERRWAGKLAWLLRFRLDISAPPRLLAARSDELYVESDAQALRDEKPALTEDEWEQHIGPRSRYRAQERARARKAEREAKGWQERLAWARSTAKAKGYDIRSETRRLERLVSEGKHEKAMRQLALIEDRVFPAAA